MLFIHIHMYTYSFHFTDNFIFELYILSIFYYKNLLFLLLFYIIFNKDISIIIKQQKFG